MEYYPFLAVTCVAIKTPDKFINDENRFLKRAKKLNRWWRITYKFREPNSIITCLLSLIIPLKRLLLTLNTDSLHVNIGKRGKNDDPEGNPKST